MSRIEREKATIAAMIGIYCRDKHHSGKGRLCKECCNLLEYATGHLNRCKFGNNKPVCSKCKVHCYKPSVRSEVVEVMRYAGPRMPREHPIMALEHLLAGFKGNRSK